MAAYRILGKRIEAKTYSDAARMFLQNPEAEIYDFPYAGELWIKRHKGHAIIYICPESCEFNMSPRKATVLFNIVKIGD